MPAIKSATTIIGLEVHVELATRSKMFSRAPNPAHPAHRDAAPNTLIDETVLALPGALPVMNEAAIEMAMRVGLALRCSIAGVARWDRKSYFYPDMPKAYQISQYDLPLCFDGALDLPAIDDKGFPDLSREGTRIGIIRAHLEEDAGKLLHEAPGGRAIEHSIVDYNRAGTPLLEIVTQPDFRSADEAVMFAKTLRNICRFLGVSEGVMQQGHMRFEPNINCELALDDGHAVRTPIVEIKNLNSFRALKGAIEFEAREQPLRWERDGRTQGPGTKVTRGWDDARGVTLVQREKEDAHDYRYFPDPDLPVVHVAREWRDRVERALPELPLARFRRFTTDFALGAKEAYALIEERDDCLYYEACIDEMVGLGLDHARAGKVAANIVLQSGAKRANERHVPIAALGASPMIVAALAKLREDGAISAHSLDALFGEVCDAGPGASESARAALVRIEAIARERGLLIVRDDSALREWIDSVVSANPGAAADVRAGKTQAVGRLVGEVMKRSGGSADARTVREAILKQLGAS